MKYLTTRFGSALALATTLTGFAVFGVSPALAVTVVPTAPAGALFNLATAHPTALTGYTQFSFQFLAGKASTAISFAFRDDASRIGFDDVSMTLKGSTTNLIVNPGFESFTGGTIGVATTWTHTVNANTPGTTTGVRTGDGAFIPHTGSRFWYDGTANGYDTLAQTVATTVNSQYTVSFWIYTAATLVTNDPKANVLGYASDSQPVNMSAVPEPETYALMLAGLGALGFLARRRKG